MRNAESATSSWPPSVEAASAWNRVVDASPYRRACSPPHFVPWKPLKAVAIATMASTATSTISTTFSHSCCGGRSLMPYPGSTLIARAMTRMAVINEITDSTNIVIFAQIRTGKVSVGLKAVAFVNDRKR